MSEQHLTEFDHTACVRPSTLRKVITEAMADAERTGMTGETRDEWVSIAILGSRLIPLGPHFPAEGGGPCPHCGGVDFVPVPNVTECPDCGQTGRYDRRVIVDGRGVYTCPDGHRWQDADETPDGKGYAVISPGQHPADHTPRAEQGGES